MLFLIGLGLGDESDITVKGLELLKQSSEVWLESYTAILTGVDVEALSKFYGKQVNVADREMIESGIQSIIERAKKDHISILVVGDPYGATTHMDLWLRARKMGTPIQVVHNASIMNAIGVCGVNLYNFGQTVSIPLFQENWRPDSFYDKIEVNKNAGMHTLCLLDIKVKEPNFDKLAKTGKMEFNPPYFMTIAEACSQLLEVEEKKGRGVVSPETRCIGVARVGRHDQVVVAGTLQQIMQYPGFGEPLHSMVVVGEIHPLEEEILAEFAIRS